MRDIGSVEGMIMPTDEQKVADIVPIARHHLDLLYSDQAEGHIHAENESLLKQFIKECGLWEDFNRWLLTLDRSKYPL